MKSKKKKVTFQVPESPKLMIDEENVVNSNAHINNERIFREDFWSNLTEEGSKKTSVKVTPDPRKQMKHGKRFKLSNCTSTKPKYGDGEVSEFGHFQILNASNFGDKQKSSKKKDLDNSGMKRKLFDEPLGPQTF